MTVKFLSGVVDEDEEKILKVLESDEYDRACQKIYGEKRSLITGEKSA